MSIHGNGTEKINDAAIDGAERAGRALTTLLGRPFTVEHVDSTYVPSANGAILLSMDVQHDQAAIGQMSITGAVNGCAFVVMSQNSMDEMFNRFDVSHATAPEMSDSLLREVSNITASSYINALADCLSIEMSPSPVEMNYPNSGLSQSLTDAARRDWPAIVFHCTFASDQGSYAMSLVMLMNSDNITLFNDKD